MDFVVYQMVQFQKVHITHGYRVVEGFAGTAVIQLGLSVLPLAGGFQAFPDIFLAGAVKYRGHDFPPQSFGGIAQVDFQHLTDIHTRGNTQGVEHNIQRRTIGQEGHILLGQDPGDNTFVSMASRHLVTNGDFSALGDIASYHHVNAGFEFIGVVPGIDLYIYNRAIFSMGDPQRGIPDFPGFFTENSPQQPLFGSQFGLAFRCHLTYQDITGVYLGTNPDDSPLIQVFPGVLFDIGNIPGDFLWAQFGIPGLNLIFLNVDGGKHVLPHTFLVEQHRVLIVITFPVHEGNKGVFPQTDLSVIGCRAVSDNLALSHLLANVYDRPLVNTGALVGAEEFNQFIGVELPSLCFDDNLVGADPE